MKPARSIAPEAFASTIVSEEQATTTRMPTSAEIKSYMPLVHQAVARFLRRLPPNVLKDDLVAAGMYGLVDALRKNGEERGPTFEWYARVRIRGAIFDELRSQDWLTRRQRAKATSASGDESAPSARAAVVGLDDLSGNAAAATLVDEGALSPLDAVEKKMEQAAVADAVSTLPERERFIVQAHYFEGIQFKAIAAKLGVSEPRVSQLHTRAMQLLRAAVEKSSRVVAA